MSKEIITIEEIMDFLRENMVTKEDAKVFATKDDLKSFATKDDFFLLKYELAEVKENMVTKKELSSFRDEVITYMDGLTKNYTDYQYEVASLHSRCDRLDTRLSKVEDRIRLSK
jgi:hypothetical protein